MRFKAVIFDMDGTLLDTLESLAGAMNAVLRKWGFSPHPVEQYRYFVGNGVEELVRRALPEDARSPERVTEGTAAMRREYAERWRAGTRAYDGIGELLAAVRRAGLRTAILSNKMHDFTQEMARTLFPSPAFDAVLGAREGVPKKPDPAGAMEIVRRFGLAPGDFFYLGDSGVDMTTARRAGMYPVGVLWGFREAAELVESGARMLVTRPRDLIDWL